LLHWVATGTFAVPGLFESQSNDTVNEEPDCVPDLEFSRPPDRNVIVPSAWAVNAPVSTLVSVGPALVGDLPWGSTDVWVVVRGMLNSFGGVSVSVPAVAVMMHTAHGGPPSRHSGRITTGRAAPLIVRSVKIDGGPAGWDDASLDASATPATPAPAPPRIA